jgi:uncharacterized OB-fold protein
MTTIQYDTNAGQEELRKRGVRPVPKPDALTSPYWDAAHRGELQIQHCKQCGEYQHPPAEACKQCSSHSLEWSKVSGKGRVYSFVIDHRLLVPSFTEPYAVAQIVPDEAKRDTVRVTANIRNCPPSDVYIGMPVEVLFEKINDKITLPQFKPAAGAKMRSRGETPPTNLL